MHTQIMTISIVIITGWLAQASAYACDPGYTDINGDCYFDADLDVLDTIITNSAGSINLILDSNNDGVVSPLELCAQQWVLGRLTELDCGPTLTNNTYNWMGVSGEVPETISNWTELSSVSFEHNDLVGLVPESICELNVDFSDPNEFNFQSNHLCPPYPECIEAHMDTQSNWGTGSCEVGNCYDVGVVEVTSLETDGDNLLNPIGDSSGAAKMLITMTNNGPHCSSYPGLMITADISGVYFAGAMESEPEGTLTWWWYAMGAGETYFSVIPFEVSPFVPPGTEFTLTAETVVMNCMDETCLDDPYCHECPLTPAMSITLTVGEAFPTQPGDVNGDGLLNVIDVVQAVDLVFIGDYYSLDPMVAYLTDLNADAQINVVDVVTIVAIILES